MAYGFSSTVFGVRFSFSRFLSHTPTFDTIARVRDRYWRDRESHTNFTPTSNRTGHVSSRIEEILEVLEEAIRLWEVDGGRLAPSYYRNEAVKHVATRRGILSTSVSNKFRRELGPDIWGTPAFDARLAAWFRSQALRKTPAKRARPQNNTGAHAHTCEE